MEKIPHLNMLSFIRYKNTLINVDLVCDGKIVLDIFTFSYLMIQDCKYQYQLVD